MLSGEPVGPAVPWQTMGRTTVFESRWMQVVRDAVRQPDGELGLYDHVILPASVTVFAVGPGRTGFEVAVTRQWIYTHGGTQWRLPAGGVGPDETPQVAAERELAEEVGVVGARFRPLGVVHGADSATNHVDHLFLATGLVLGAARPEATEADLVVHWLPIRSVVTMVLDGAVPHAGSTAAVLLGANRLGVL